MAASSAPGTRNSILSALPDAVKSPKANKSHQRRVRKRAEPVLFIGFIEDVGQPPLAVQQEPKKAPAEGVLFFPIPEPSL
jgi:hypothetical protein